MLSQIWPTVHQIFLAPDSETSPFTGGGQKTLDRISDELGHAEIEGDLAYYILNVAPKRDVFLNCIFYQGFHFCSFDQIGFDSSDSFYLDYNCMVIGYDSEDCFVVENAQPYPVFVARETNSWQPEMLAESLDVFLILLSKYEIVWKEVMRNALDEKTNQPEVDIYPVTSMKWFQIELSRLAPNCKEAWEI
jgi:hypothetical protein